MLIVKLMYLGRLQILIYDGIIQVIFSWTEDKHILWGQRSHTRAKLSVAWIVLPTSIAPAWESWALHSQGKEVPHGTPSETGNLGRWMHKHCQSKCSLFFELLSVMVLAGTELIFFIEGHIMLCLGFLIKTEVITLWHFSCCRAVLTYQPRTLLLLALPCHRGGWGCTWTWRGTQPGQHAQTGQRDVPHHRGADAKEEEGGTLGVMAFVLPRSHSVCSALQAWEQLSLPMGSSEGILRLALLVSPTLALLGKLSSQPMSSHFYFSDYLPHPTWGKLLPCCSQQWAMSFSSKKQF